MRGPDWTDRGDHMHQRHGITPLILSGRSVRTIGYSPTARTLITVITLEHGGVSYGVNGWEANQLDRRRYQEGTA